MEATALFLATWLIVYAIASFVLRRTRPAHVARARVDGMLLVGALALTVVAWKTFDRLVMEPRWARYQQDLEAEGDWPTPVPFRLAELRGVRELRVDGAEHASRAALVQATRDSAHGDIVLRAARSERAPRMIVVLRDTMRLVVASVTPNADGDWLQYPLAEVRLERCDRRERDCEEVPPEAPAAEARYRVAARFVGRRTWDVRF